MPTQVQILQYGLAPILPFSPSTNVILFSIYSGTPCMLPEESWKIIDFPNQAHLKFGQSWFLMNYEKHLRSNCLLISKCLYIRYIFTLTRASGDYYGQRKSRLIYIIHFWAPRIYCVLVLNLVKSAYFTTKIRTF